MAGDDDEPLDFLSLSDDGPEPEPAPKTKPEPAPKPKVKKSSKKRISFKTTQRFVGDEDQMHNMPQAVMVYGGMIVQLPAPIFAVFLRGMEGKGWSGLRHDEYKDLVGGMREIARRMDLTPAYLQQVLGERNAEPKEDDEPDLDDLLEGL